MSPTEFIAGWPEAGSSKSESFTATSEANSDRPEGKDRRNSQRFPLQLAVRYRLIGTRATSEWVSAESVNISSSGLLFQAAEEIQPGQGIEAFVAWPVSLDNRVPLKLAIKGPVVRMEGNHAAVRFERYEFKTRSAEVALG